MKKVATALIYILNGRLVRESNHLRPIYLMQCEELMKLKFDKPCLGIDL